MYHMYVYKCCIIYIILYIVFAAIFHCGFYIYIHIHVSYNHGMNHLLSGIHIKCAGAPGWVHRSIVGNLTRFPTSLGIGIWGLPQIVF